MLLPSTSKKSIVDFFWRGAYVLWKVHSDINNHNYCACITDSFYFCRFKNELVAREILMRIHQKEILDSRLIVEFVDSGYVTREENEEKSEIKTDTPTKIVVASF